MEVERIRVGYLASCLELIRLKVAQRAAVRY